MIGGRALIQPLFVLDLLRLLSRYTTSSFHTHQSLHHSVWKRGNSPFHFHSLFSASSRVMRTEWIEEDGKGRKSCSTEKKFMLFHSVAFRRTSVEHMPEWNIENCGTTWFSFSLRGNGDECCKSALPSEVHWEEFGKFMAAGNNIVA